MLKVISRSAFDLQTVLETLVVSAARLCEADEGTIFQPRDDAYRLTASCGLSPPRKVFLESCSFQPGTGSTIGRVLLEGKTVHIEDFRLTKITDFKIRKCARGSVSLCCARVHPSASSC